MKISRRRKIIIYFTLLLLLSYKYKENLIYSLIEDPQKHIKSFFASGGLYTDRNGHPLRFVANNEGDFIYPVSLDEQAKTLIDAVLIIEDKNFYKHPGYDIFAMCRAFYQNLANLRVVSGASTITQQLIRITQPKPRKLSTKFYELCSSIILEKQLTKDKILENYLNSVCFFGNIRGTAMASLLLYGKSPNMLNLAESATLAAAIQAPGRYNPFKKAGNLALLKRRNRILKSMLEAGKCSKKKYDAAILEQIPTYGKKKPFNGPHFCDFLKKQFSKPVGIVKTTLDLNLQNKVVSTIKSHMPRLTKSGANQCSVLILDSNTLETLAFVGSAEYGPIAQGYNNGIVALRSGGSVLKPFLYALAFEMGFYPSYVISDTMQSFRSNKGDYLPENANRKNYGPVSMRSALGNSLNISAVKVLNYLGIETFYKMLTDLGLLAYKKGKDEFYGLGLAIGNPEINMLSLGKAFSIFTNGGVLKNLRFLEKERSYSRPIISKESAHMVFDILADESARLKTFGNPSFFKTQIPTAIKTGTSTAYRDCWLVSNDGHYTCVIWVGNFNGCSTGNLTGATACGPIFRDINKQRKNLRKIERDEGDLLLEKVCSISGQPPSELCKPTGKDIFKKGEYKKLEKCTFHKKSSEKHELTPDYASWLAIRGRQLDEDPFTLKDTRKGQSTEDTDGTKASNAFSIKNNNEQGLVNIEIVSPHDGDRYVHSNFHDTTIYLRAIPSQRVEEIVWLINGEEFMRTTPPYEAYWNAEPGHYRILAISDGAAAGEVFIEVE